jgi:hypothetical protein
MSNGHPITRVYGGREPVWLIAPDKEHAAAFYRNSLIHAFLETSIVELALAHARHADGDRMEAFWAQAMRSGTYDPNAAAKAKTGFQDFLYRFPNSEKGAQARENLKALESKQTSTAFEIAKYYDKQKYYRAAAIYYNDVIRQQPGSREGDRAKKRISELRAKLGDKALQPPSVTAAAANRKSKKMHTAPSHRSDVHNDAPLPPPDTDVSLPPPASLLPDTTTAPSSTTTDTLPTPAPSATPEAAATPE